MFSIRCWVAAALLVGVGAIESGLAVAQSSDVARRAAPAPAFTADRLPPDAALVYNYVKRSTSGEFNWQRIPWQVDLPAAMRQAKVENRPVLLWVAGDEPLQRC